jgi:hypothetical protein
MFLYGIRAASRAIGKEESQELLGILRNEVLVKYAHLMRFINCNLHNLLMWPSHIN